MEIYFWTTCTLGVASTRWFSFGIILTLSWPEGISSTSCVGRSCSWKFQRCQKEKRLRKWEQVPVTMRNDKNTKGFSFRRWLWEGKMREISKVVLGQSVTSVQSGRPPAWLPLARLFLYMMLCFSCSSWSLWWWRWWWWWRSHVQKRKFSQKKI